MYVNMMSKQVEALLFLSVRMAQDITANGSKAFKKQKQIKAKSSYNGQIRLL